MISNWHWVKLDDVKETNCRAIVSGPFGSNIGMRFFVPEGIPVIRGNNLTADLTRFVDDGFVFITEAKSQELANCEALPGDLIFTAAGSLGQVGLIPENSKYSRYIISNKQMRARLDPNKIDRLFAFYWLSSPQMVEYIRQQNTGSSVPLINLSILRNLPIPLPSLSEQHTIVEVLGSLDDKIELNRHMNATLEEMAQALFKHWFVDNPEAKAWEVKSLDKIANFLNGLALQKYPPENDIYLPVIKIAQLRKNNTEEADKASIKVPPEYVVYDGDILFSWSGSLEVVIWCGGKGALNQHLFKVTSEEYPKWFYYQWIKHHLSEFQDIAAGKTTTMGHIQRYHLALAKVYVPDKQELSKMDEIMYPIIDRVISNNLESRTLTNIRDTFLPRLMRGEIRLEMP